MSDSAKPFTYESLPDLSGQTAVITGCSSGVGIATAMELARKGAHVLCLARNKEKTQPVIDGIIKETGNEKVEFIPCDLLSLRSVTAAADAVAAKALPVNMLILNAGMIGAPGKMARSEDGIEVTWVVNHFSHFLLARRLLPLLERSVSLGTPARVVAVSSAAQSFAGYKEGIRFDAYDDESKYEMFNRYAETKLANILMVREMQRKVEEKLGKGVGFYANSCHPGAVNSELGDDYVWSWIRPVFSAIKSLVMITPSEGAKSSVFLAAASDVQTHNIRGQYYMDRARPPKPKDLCAAAGDEALAKRLWEWSEEVLTEKGVGV
ncbi:NAD(P)-binding protein [Gonapodya prolifera JEL478]|uniref:NAD(P)-binding protein n=1 Tax=Gonapodya prolifera (strain JEL478) TaxID=1344416 RepID=A0A139A4X5_GONPJ|nr:NAD(P)-binding protein [Gonapodya prolifera JEL478]|eukprot:KXS11840.1 NAD(P)-binding protein [Gonapodya prolifera JEL478]